MRPRFQRTIGLLAVAGMLVVACQAHAAKQFRLKFKQGQIFKVTMNQETKQTISVMGQTQEMPMTMVMEMTWDITDASADGFTIVQTIDRVQMKMKIPMQGEVNYDSKNPGGGGQIATMLGTMFKPMLNTKFEQKMNRLGKVLEVNIPDSALKGIEANPLLKKFFSKDAFQEMMSKMSPVLPEKAIDKGFSWESSVETPAPFGKMKMKTKYTYEGEEVHNNKKLDKFGIVLNIEMEMQPGATALLKVQDQKSTGTMYFDSEAGYFVENVINQEMTIAGQAGGQQFTQKLKTVTRLTTTPVTK